MRIALKALKAILLWPFVCKNWWVGVFSYLGLTSGNKEVLYRLRSGLDLEASGDSGDFQIVKEVFYINLI